MILFLERLRLRREEKLAKLERKYLQRSCPHDYHITREFRECFENYVDVYCPICEHEVLGRLESKHLREENKRVLREIYGVKAYE